MNDSDERGERRQRRAHELPAAVHWHEGMLLAPQHFQLASRRDEALLHYHASIVSPFHWGVVNLERKRIADGVLSVTRVAAVLPDGLVVSYPPRLGQGGADLSIDLKPRLANIAQGHRTVFLAVAARQPGERFSQRYDYAAEQVLEESTGVDDLSVQMLQPKLQLVLADYLPESSVGFPIARVTARAGTVEELDFEPPWLQVSSGTAIYDICSAIAEVLRQTGKALQTSIAGESQSERAPELLETRMLIHSLVSGLPTLEALLRTESAHPFALYLALASVAGNLAPGAVPERVEAYDHDDLLRVFRSLAAAIERTIHSSIHAAYTLHPFTAVEDSFRLRIDPSWMRRPMLLGVRPAEGVKKSDLDEWVVQSTIGSASKIDSLRIRRISGVKREPMRETSLVPASGVSFYELQPPYDDLLLPSEDLVISNGDRERRPHEVVLYVKTGV